MTGNLILSGYTSPNATVTFLRDNAVAGNVIACPGGPPAICTSSTQYGYFEKLFTGLYPGIYNFGIYATDSSTPELSTPIVTRSLAVLEGVPSTTDPMTLPPTIKVDKPVMKRPETQTLTGMGRANSKVRVAFNNQPNPEDQTIENSGIWNDTSRSVLHLGTNIATATIQSPSGAISEPSKMISFVVEMSADLNLDLYVDITDFSILMFNYGDDTPQNWAADINDDAFIDLADFSIMMFNWAPDTTTIPTPTPSPSDTPTPTPPDTPTPTLTATPTP
jgi:hypothetical protein